MSVWVITCFSGIAYSFPAVDLGFEGTPIFKKKRFSVDRKLRFYPLEISYLRPLLIFNPLLRDHSISITTMRFTKSDPHCVESFERNVIYQ
jgi:hypothetical protein